MGVGKNLSIVKSQLKISSCIDKHFTDLWNKNVEYFQ